MSDTIKVLIADDEELARRLLREYLGRHPDMEVVGECENGMQAVKEIGRLQPDLVLLDIQMPKLTGLEVLELTERYSGVIFTTAYDQYALKAFDFHAVDYLLKPFSQQRFDEALAQARKSLGQASPAIKEMAARPGEKLERILVRDRSQVHVIPVEKLEYAEAQDDYVCLHSDGRDYLKTQSLSELEAQLDAGRFVRVHRSYIVNVEQLQSIEKQNKDSQVAVMRSGKQIPISRPGYERIKTIM
jgi:two-component system LytT family response regulator